MPARATSTATRSFGPAVAAMLIAILFGIPLGLWAGLKPDGAAETVAAYNGGEGRAAIV